jgi:hypothetical protein
VSDAEEASGTHALRKRRWLVVAVLVAGFHVADCLVMRLFASPSVAEQVPSPAVWGDVRKWLAGPDRRPLFPRQPRADRLKDYEAYEAWREACEWVATSGEIPATARFLTPRMSQTFKWYAHRGEVGTWKEVPQDAEGLVKWWDIMQDIHGTGEEWPLERWYESLADLGPQRLRELGAKYNADYAIMNVTDPRLPLPFVYKNESYIIYDLAPVPKSP